jgi:hypothetical protein
MSWLWVNCWFTVTADSEDEYEFVESCDKCWNISLPSAPRGDPVRLCTRAAPTASATRESKGGEIGKGIQGDSVDEERDVKVGV